MEKQKGGYGVVYQEITRNEKIPAAAKGLYAYLAAFCGKSDECYPTVKTISSEMGFSPETYYKYIKILVAAGVVKKKQVKEQDGRFGRTIYKLTHEVTVYQNSDLPNTEKPYAEIPNTENPHTKNNKNLKITDSNNNSINNAHSAADSLFNELWQLYPNRKGKGQVSEESKKRLSEIGREEMERAIERYKAELKKDSWRQPQYGSTFFNSGYVDYLDANYTPGETPKAKNDFLNHEQSGTDYAELEKLLE